MRFIQQNIQEARSTCWCYHEHNPMMNVNIHGTYKPNFVVGSTQGIQLCLKNFIALMKSQLRIYWACKNKIMYCFQQTEDIW